VAVTLTVAAGRRRTRSGESACLDPLADRHRPDRASRICRQRANPDPGVACRKGVIPEGALGVNGLSFCCFFGFGGDLWAASGAGRCQGSTRRVDRVAAVGLDAGPWLALIVVCRRGRLMDVVSNGRVVVQAVRLLVIPSPRRWRHGALGVRFTGPIKFSSTTWWSDPLAVSREPGSGTSHAARWSRQRISPSRRP
jgi:hypothetical protein